MSKNELFLKGNNEIKKGSIQFSNKEYDKAAKNFKAAMDNYEGAKKSTDVNLDLDEKIEKSLLVSKENYCSSLVCQAKELEVDIKTNFTTIETLLNEAITIFKSDKSFENKLIVAEKNMATCYANAEKYEEAIKAFKDLITDHASVDKNEINTNILNIYAHFVQADDTKLGDAFNFAKDLGQTILKKNETNSEYICTHYAKNLLLENKDIAKVIKTYDSFSTSSKGLVDNLYQDGLYAYSQGVAKKDKAELKNAVTILTEISTKQKVCTVEINDYLSELVKDYGTKKSKDDLNDLILGDHSWGPTDFDFA